MIQARVNDPTGNNSKGVFTSPMRDVAHCMPYAIRQAIQLASDRIDALVDLELKNVLQDELAILAVGLAKYVKIAAADPEVKEYRAARTKAALDITTDAFPWFDAAFKDVMFQIYFQGIREALHGEKPLGVDVLMKFVDERSNAIK